jgi:hypothetical protein
MRIRSVDGTIAGGTRRAAERERSNPLEHPRCRLIVEPREEVLDMMRRRPLRRAAVVGGVAVAAHHAGARSAQAQAAAQGQNEQAADPQAVPPGNAPPPAAPAAEVGGSDMVTQLENLKKLLDEGVLTQAEFDTEKQKLLAST